MFSIFRRSSVIQVDSTPEPRPEPPVQPPTNESSHVARLIQDTLRELENIQQSQAEKIREQEDIIKQQAQTIHRQAARIRRLNQSADAPSTPANKRPKSSAPSSPAKAPPPHSGNITSGDVNDTHNRQQPPPASIHHPQTGLPTDQQVAFAAVRSLIARADFQNKEESGGKKRPRDGQPLPSAQTKNVPSSFTTVSRLWDFFGGKTPPSTLSPPSIYFCSPTPSSSTRAIVGSSSDVLDRDFDIERASKRRRLSPRNNGPNKEKAEDNYY